MSSSQSPSTSSLSHKNRSMCIVPKEWKYYSPETVNDALYKNINNHWNNYGKVEGTVVQIGDVAARLEYQNDRFWMRRYGDPRSKPHPREYSLTYLEHCKCPRQQFHCVTQLAVHVFVSRSCIRIYVQSLKLLDDIEYCKKFRVHSVV